MSDIPLNLDEVSADWLTGVLGQSGMLDGGRVVGLDARVVGQGAGFMGHVAKLDLTLSPTAGRPVSLVLKIPTETDNRRIGQTVGVYEREIRFYQELQPLLDIRTPRHIYSAMDSVTDPERTIKALKLMDRMPVWLIRTMLPVLNWLGSRAVHRYVLLLENLEDYRIGDQVGGCSPDEARLVLDAMARMHARFWGGAELETFPWLLSLDLASKPLQMMYLQGVEPFKRFHAAWLEPHHLAVLDWLAVHYFDLVRQFGRMPDTLSHGDFRLDNLCFDDERGEVILFDWQTLGRGPCGFDLAYFLSAAFASPPSRREVDDLVEYYGACLSRYGVEIAAEDLRWQFDAGLLAVVHRLVPAQFQDMLDLGEGRGADLIDSWLERGFRDLERIDLDRILR